MPLIRKRKESAWHALTLKRPEKGQCLCDGGPVVLVAACHQCRRCVAKFDQAIWPCRVELVEIFGLDPWEHAFAEATVIRNLVCLENPSGQIKYSVVPNGATKLACVSWHAASYFFKTHLCNYFMAAKAAYHVGAEAGSYDYCFILVKIRNALQVFD